MIITVFTLLHIYMWFDHFLTTAAMPARNLLLPCLVPGFLGQAQARWWVLFGEMCWATSDLSINVAHGECCVLNCVLRNSDAEFLTSSIAPRYCLIWKQSLKTESIKTRSYWSSVCVRAQLCPNSLWPHGRQPIRLLCPWNFPAKNTGVGCHFLP